MRPKNQGEFNSYKNNTVLVKESRDPSEPVHDDQIVQGVVATVQREVPEKSSGQSLAAADTSRRPQFHAVLENKIKDLELQKCLESLHRANPDREEFDRVFDQVFDSGGKTIMDLANPIIYNDPFDPRVRIPPFFGARLVKWNLDNHWPRKCVGCSELPVFPGTEQGLCDFCQLDVSLPQLSCGESIRAESFSELASTLKSYIFYLISTPIRAVSSALGDVFVSQIRTCWQSFLQSLPSTTTTVLTISVSIMIVSLICKFASWFANITITAIEMTLKALSSAGLALCGSILESLHKIVASPKDEPKSIIAESSSDFGPGVQLLAAMITVLSPFSAAGGYTAAASLKALTSARLVLSGVGIMKTSLDTLVSKLPQTVSDYAWETFRVGLTDVTEEDKVYLVHSLELLAKVQKNPELMNEMSYAERVCSTYERLEVLYAECISLSPGSMHRIILKAISDYKVLLPQARKIYNSRSSRVEPLGIWLFSDPGVGKTSMMASLSAALFPHLAPATRLFSPTNGVSYLNGYSGEPVFFIDEPTALGGKESKATLAQCLEYISTKPVNVNMASIEEKKRMFTSRLVIAAANVDLRGSMGLQNDDALRRRFTQIRVTLRDGWATPNGTLNSDLITARLRSGALTEDQAMTMPWLCFTPYVFTKTNNPNTRYMPLVENNEHVSWTYTQFKAYVAAGLQRKQEQYETAIGIHAKIEEHNKTDISVKCWTEDGVAALLPTPTPIANGDCEREEEEVHAVAGVPHLAPELPSFDTPIPQDEEIVFDDGLSGGVVAEMYVAAPRSQSSKERASRFGLLKGAHFKREAVPRHKRTKPSTPAPTLPRLNDDVRNAIILLQSDEGSDFGEVLREWYEEHPPPEVQRRAAEWSDKTREMAGGSVIHATDVENIKHEFFTRRLAIKCKRVVRFTRRMCGVLWGYYLTCVTMTWATFAKCAFAVSAVGGVVMLIYKGISREAEAACQAVAEQMDGKESVPRPVRQARVHAPRKAQRAGPYLPQQGGYSLADDVLVQPDMDPGIRNGIYGNLVKIRVPGGGNYGYYVCGSYLVTTLHTFLRNDKPLGEGQVMTIETSTGKVVECAFEASRLTSFPSTQYGFVDVCMYDTGSAFSPFKDIRKFFAFAADLDKMWDRDYFITSLSQCSKLTGLKNVRKQMCYQSLGSHLEANCYLRYDICTKYGDCGSLIVAPHGGSTAVIVGHHVAAQASKHSSMAQVVTRETIDALVASYGVEPDPPVVLPVEVAPVHYSRLVPAGRTPVGRILDKKLLGGTSGATKYSPSAIAHEEPFCHLDMYPAVLSSSEYSGNALMVKRKEKYLHADKPTSLDPVYLGQAGAALEAMLEPIYKESGGVLTWSEVLNGGGRYSSLSSFPRDTSIGFPEKFSMKKSDVLHFDEEEKTWKFTESYLDNLVKVEDRLAGEGVSWVFESVLKDEILPSAKVDKSDTRCITICPMEFNLLMKKYFGAYFNACVANVGDIPFCVGMDVASSDWNTMMTRLFEISPDGFDGDYIGFEYMHTHQPFDAFLAHVERFYTRATGIPPSEHDRKMRRRLLRAAQHCFIKLGPVIHATSEELASGIWLTIIINCYFCAMYLLYAFFTLAAEHSPAHATTTACLMHLALAVMGDDNMSAVAAEIASWFNGYNVQKVLSEVGRGFSPAEKGAVFGENRSLLELGFLSGKTKVHTYERFKHVRYHYALEPVKCMKQVAWVSKDAGERGLEDNVNSCLRAFWPQGRVAFDCLRDRIILCCSANNYKLAPISYDDEYSRRTLVEREKSLLAETFSESASNSFGRVYKLKHFTSEQWVRFFATVTVALENSESQQLSFSVSDVLAGHPIIESIEVETILQRALKLSEAYDGQVECGDWLADAGITSTAGLSCVYHGKTAIMIDGNNRLGAIKMACHMLGLDTSRMSWCLPAHQRRAGPLKVLWECRQVPAEGKCDFCSCEDCNCQRLIQLASIRAEMEVDVHDNDDHAEEILSPAPGSVAAPDSAAVISPLASLLDVAKRYGTSAVFDENLVPGGVPALGALSGAYGDAGSLRNGPATFVMDMYVMFAGAIRFMVYSPREFILGGTVEAPIPMRDVVEDGRKAGLLPYAQGSSRVNFQGAQLPFLSRFNGVLIPRTSGEAETDPFNSGIFNLSLMQDDQSFPWKGRVMTSLGDDSMLWGLYRVPRQIVTGTVHPHNDKGDNVPVALRFVNVAGEPAIAIKQAWTISPAFPAYYARGKGDSVSWIDINTQLLSNEDLSNFGFPVPTGRRKVVANWRPSVEGDLSLLRVYPGTVIARSSSVGERMNSSYAASSVGTNYIRTVENDTVDVATEHVFDSRAYGQDEFRKAVGLTNSLIVVPSGASVTIPFLHDAPQEVNGVTFNRICRNKALLVDVAREEPVDRTPFRFTLLRNDVEAEMDKSEGVGVTFVEDSQTSVSRVARLPASMLPPTMSGGDYSYEDLLNRMTKVDTIEWAQNEAPLSVLASYVAPFDLFRGAVTRMIQRFQYFRGDMVVRFNVQSSPFHSGKVIASFLPLRNDAASRTEHTSSTTNLTLNQHCVLFAGDNSSVELRVPWLHLKSMLEPNNASSEIPLGTLSLVVVNPLTTGPENTDSVQISMFVSFDNVGLKVLRANADIVAEMGFLSSLGSNVQRALKGTVDVISAVSNIAGLSRDKPNVGQSGEAVIRQGYPYICNASGVEQNVVLALECADSINPTQGMVGTSVNETHTAYLYSKFTQFATHEAISTMRFGDVIASGNICPIQKLNTLAFQESTQESLLGYLSSWHTFWTGGIELKFEFVGTRYHKMRLVFCYHYGSLSERLVGEEAMQQFIVMYDYSYDNPTFTVSLPWRTPTSMLKVPPGSDVEQGVHSSGQWSLRVDAPLVAMESVSQKIDVNVFIRGGEGFKLMGFYDTSIDYENMILGQQSE